LKDQVFTSEVTSVQDLKKQKCVSLLSDYLNTGLSVYGQQSKARLQFDKQSDSFMGWRHSCNFTYFHKKKVLTLLG
jgi:hypothetical protein